MDARAREHNATDRLDSERRKVKAIDRLHQFFQDEQHALTTQFTQPLAEKISGYLQSLFGHGAQDRVTLDENRFTGLRLFRPGTDGTELPFDNLSAVKKNLIATGTVISGRGRGGSVTRA